MGRQHGFCRLFAQQRRIGPCRCGLRQQRTIAADQIIVHRLGRLGVGHRNLTLSKAWQWTSQLPTMMATSTAAKHKAQFSASPHNVWRGSATLAFHSPAKPP